MIDFTIAYVLGLATFSLFLVTRKFLRTRRGNEPSKTERCLYILNVFFLVWMVLLAPMVFAMELLFIFTIPVQSWPHIVELFNEYSYPFSQIAIMFVATIVASFVCGYFGDWQRKPEFVITKGNQWLWALLVLYVIVYVIVGLIGALTGLLV